MEIAKKEGFEAIELSLDMDGETGLDFAKEDMEKIVKLSKEVGIEIASLTTGLYWDYSLTAGNPETAAKAKEIAKKQIEMASYLKVDTVLVVPGAVDVFFKPEFEKEPYDVIYERSLKVMKELAKTAEEYKINIGMENVWNKFLLSPLEMRDFIDKIDSPYVGSYFDVGNVLLFGFPQDWIKILGKRIKKIHFKDFKTEVGTFEGFCDLLEGDVSWPEVMKAIKGIGYDDYITAEFVGFRDDLLEKTSKAMDKIFGM
jgi:hexulose-6-phosphate isomerase